MTEFEYDGAGRLVRAVTTREPLYTEQDVAELTALAVWRDSLCPHCHRPIDDCRAATEGSGAKFEISRRVCHAQLALVESQAAVHDAETDRGKKQPPPVAAARIWSLSVRPARR